MLQLSLPEGSGSLRVTLVAVPVPTPPLLLTCTVKPIADPAATEAASAVWTMLNRGLIGEFVSEKIALLATPATLAVTLYDPTVPFAVKAGAVPTPKLSVATVAVMEPPKKVPLAPEPGAAKNTVTLGTTLPRESRTVTCKGLENAVLIVALWLPPAVTAIEAGGYGGAVTGCSRFSRIPSSGASVTCGAGEPSL
jgi:hypothetical protein